jgi:hypothetical protein
MGFAGPREDNVYLVDNKAFATAVLERPCAVIQNPDATAEDALVVASRGHIFTELLIRFGPGGWPEYKAAKLKRVVQNWMTYSHEYRRNLLSDLLLRPFNSLFPPATHLDAQEWARVQWKEPVVRFPFKTTWPHIHAESVDSQFTVDFHFTAEHVSVSYCGPVCFSMDVVQPTALRIFTSNDVFDTASGDWDLSDGKFWPVNEALVIADYQQNWDRLMLQLNPRERQHILEIIEDLLKEGFIKLMRMLPSAGQERHLHKLDLERWKTVEWKPIVVRNSSFHKQSECENYSVTWQFRTTGSGENLVCNEVSIDCSGPFRFVRKNLRRGANPS